MVYCLMLLSHCCVCQPLQTVVFGLPNSIFVVLMFVPVVAVPKP